MSLKPEHQQALLDFVYTLSGVKRSHINYAKDVLTLLSDYFNLDNTMFFLTDSPDPISIGSCLDWGDYENCRTLQDDGDSPTAPYAIQYLNMLYMQFRDKDTEQKLLSMQREMLCRYNYITINQLPVGFSRMELVRNGDLPTDARPPGLLEYMRASQLSYFVLLRLYSEDVLTGALYFFRSEEEGDFPEEDLLLMRKLSRYVSINYQNTLDYTNYVSKSQLLDCCSMRAPIGTIIIDSAFDILSVNHSGMEYCREISEYSNATHPPLSEKTLYTSLGNSDHVNQVICSIREDLDIINHSESKQIDTVSASYDICVSSFLYATIYNQMQTYYFVYITKHTDNDRLSLNELSKKYGLTSREIDILYLLEQGYNNIDIGKSLYISCNTVKAHISSIFRKLNVSSRTSLIYKIRNSNIRV